MTNRAPLAARPTASADTRPDAGSDEIVAGPAVMDSAATPRTKSAPRTRAAFT